MKTIGIVQFVQIQQSSLKEKLPDGGKRYNPSPIVRLPKIRLTADGVIGITETGEEIIDVHNAIHPNSTSRGDNGISVGFTSHYNAMRQKFGDHLSDGIAAEGIIVETDRVYTPETLGTRLAIKNVETGKLIYLYDVKAMLPCEPFSRFAANSNLAAPEMKATLQFLSEGMRGFCMTLENGQNTVFVQQGDELILLDD